MPTLHSNIARALMLGAVLAADGACTEVVVAPGAHGGTTSGSGASGGHGGTGPTGIGGNGTGGAIPVDLPWQVTAAGNVFGAEVAVDAAGNVIVAGEFEGTLDLGGGPLNSAKWGNVFVAKFDAAGHHLWSRSADHASDVRLAVDGLGDVLLAGAFREVTDFGGGPLASAGKADVFVTKLNADGEHLYSRTFGDSATQTATGIAVDAAGNAYVTGTFTGTMDFGGGPLESPDSNDVFVVALDPSGQHVWSRRFGGEGEQMADRIAVAPGGRLAVTGRYEGTPDFGGGPLPGSNSTLFAQSFLLNLDASGSHVSSDGFNCRRTSPAFDAEDHLTLAGAFTGNVDFGAGPLWSDYFIHVVTARFDAGLTLVWNRAFGDVGATLHDVGVTPAGDGSILLAGYGSGGLDFGGGQLLGGDHMGGFLARLDASGAHVWSRGFSGDGDLQGTSAAVAPSGAVYFAGTFTGTIDLIDGPTDSQGERDFFLVKIIP